MTGTGQHAEADKLFAEATKLITPSVWAFRFSPEWISATRLFERAGMLYTQAGDLDSARRAFEQAAKGHEQQYSGWHAAKDWEKAADAAGAQRDAQAVEEYTTAAVDQYMAGGRLAAAADATARGAKILEETAPEVASKMYYRAAELLDDSEKQGLSGDVYRAAIVHAVRCARWDDAVRLLLRFATLCDSLQARNSQSKAYLSAIVVRLHAGQAPEAWTVYREAQTTSVFSASDEAGAADALFAAYRTRSTEAVAAVVQDHVTFLHLDNQIARLAKRLADGPVAKISALLPSSSALSLEDEEDNLT